MLLLSLNIFPTFVPLPVLCRLQISTESNGLQVYSYVLSLLKATTYEYLKQQWVYSYTFDSAQNIIYLKTYKYTLSNRNDYA